MAPEPHEDLQELLHRVPEGWTPVRYDGRRFGLNRTTRAHGASITLVAEELGGPDLVSANVYVTSTGPQLKPCEMPADKVLRFLRDFVAD